MRKREWEAIMQRSMRMRRISGRYVRRGCENGAQCRGTWCFDDRAQLRTGKFILRWMWHQNASRKRVVRYDKDGDNHYDTISAFIKSMRGSDPDAAVYYLAKMLYAGEDIKFIARRIMICASEDVGNADPDGTDGGRLRSTGSGADRDAGGTDYFIPGSTLCGNRAKEQFCGQCERLPRQWKM